MVEVLLKDSQTGSANWHQLDELPGVTNPSMQDGVLAVRLTGANLYEYINSFVHTRWPLPWFFSVYEKGDRRKHFTLVGDWAKLWLANENCELE